MDQRERWNLIWGCGDVQKPEAWSVWEIVKNFQGKENLEVGPGNYPKIPIKDGFFVDVSEKAIENLKEIGGKAIVGDVTNLPFEGKLFDLVVAIEVLEHIEDDKKALSEITRVLKPSGFFLFSVPLRKDLYSEIDRIVGHKRRYEIEELKILLSENGFKILKYRYPSFYSKVFNIWERFFSISKIVFKSKKHVVFFNLPKFLVNLYTKSYAFIEKRGAPKWQVDIENLAKYEDKAIVIFCQKRWECPEVPKSEV